MNKQPEQWSYKNCRAYAQVDAASKLLTSYNLRLQEELKVIYIPLWNAQHLYKRLRPASP